MSVAARATDEAIRLDIALPARDAARSPLIETAPAPPTIVRALDEAPLALLGANLDFEAVEARLSEVVGGAALERDKRMLGELFGVDIDRDVLPLFSGEVASPGPATRGVLGSSRRKSESCDSSSRAPPAQPRRIERRPSRR